MAAGIDWFRWHHGSVTDPKFQLVARKANARLGDVIAVWAFILEAASASDERGTFGDLDFESIDCLLGADDGTAARIVEAMGNRGILEGTRVSSWEKRQPKREDETAAERKRRQRERDHEAEIASRVTVSASRGVTQSHAEIDDCHAESRDVTHGHDRGEKRREEKIKPQGLTSNLPHRGEVDSPQTPAPRATRFGLDSLPEDWAVFCQTERPDLDPGGTFLRFSDFWRAKAGKDGRKLDWFATWRNWVRSERAPPRSASTGISQSLLDSIRNDPRCQGGPTT